MVVIDIDRPLEKVWAVFTNPVTWADWHGGGLKEVIPGWEVGARIVWERGLPSEITGFVPQQQVESVGSSGTRVIWTFKVLEPQKTLVTLDEDFSTSTLVVIDPAARRKQNEGKLTGLKRYVEGGNKPLRPPVSEPTRAAESSETAGARGAHNRRLIVVLMLGLLVLLGLCLLLGIIRF